MTIDELIQSYSEHDLSRFPGDNDLRHRFFSPLFMNLYEDKIVYRERFVCVARLQDIKVTSESFSADAVPLIHIEFADDWRPEPPPNPWTFGGVWSALCLSENRISAPYAAWTVWPEAEFVREVERLAQAGEFQRALDLLFNAES